jgi:hypothetical protein
MKIRNILHWIHPKHRKLRRTSPETHHMLHWVHPKRRKTPGTFLDSALPRAKDELSMEEQTLRKGRRRSRRRNGGRRGRRAVVWKTRTHL